MRQKISIDLIAIMVSSLMRRSLTIKTDGKDISFYCHPEETKEDPFFTHIIKGITYKRIKGVYANNILDVGANIGAASVFFALNYPDANIFSFEPVTKNFNLLKDNTEHFKNINLFKYGAYDENKSSEIYINQRNNAGHSIIKYWRGADGEKSEKIRLINLGDFLPSLTVSNIDILKIDTEGSELPILISLSQFLPCIKVIYLEYHSSADKEKIVNILKETHGVVRDNLVGATKFRVENNILGKMCAKEVEVEGRVLINRDEVVTAEKLKALTHNKIKEVLLFVNEMGELTFVNRNKNLLFSKASEKD